MSLHSGPATARKSVVDVSAMTLCGVAVVCVVGFVLPNSTLNQLSLWMAQSLLSLSLVMVWGRCGIFSLGQSALYGVGAYAFGVIAVNLSNTIFFPWGLLGAASTTGLLALILGYFLFYGRISQLSVAIITLAFTMVSFTILNSLSAPRYAIGAAQLGGFNGMIGIPALRFGGDSATSFTQRQVFITVGVLVALVTGAVELVLRSPFGRVIGAIRENAARTQLLGYDVRRYQLMLFAASGLVAGFGGGLFAAWSGFVSPALFGLTPSVLVIIWVLVGGRSYVLGAVLGTLLIQGITSTLGGSQGQYAPIYLGVILIIAVLLMPQGLFGLLSRAALRMRRRFASLERLSMRRQASAYTTSMSEAAPSQHLLASRAADYLVSLYGANRPTNDSSSVLSVSHLTKKFGGFTAIDDIGLTFAPRTVRCIIGPNGAGKSTLFEILSGMQRPTSGRVVLGARRVNRELAFQRARSGIGIKMQTASIFTALDAYENLWIAAYSRDHDTADANSVADNLLRVFGLESDAHVRAGALSHGKQQWLEMAMVTARRPSVMLLDEPTAGMSGDETRQTAALVKALAEVASIIVIEHDMEFVRQLDAPITVLNLGKELLSGTLAEVQASALVRRVYLGQQADA